MTDFLSIYEYCMAKKGAEETYPFGEDVLVFKVGGKMFALSSPENIPPRVNLKCDPERALELRERYEAVEPGYHMSKKHWNTVVLDGSIPDNEIRDMIDESYTLVFNSLPKKISREIAEE